MSPIPIQTVVFFCRWRPVLTKAEADLLILGSEGVSRQSPCPFPFMTHVIRNVALFPGGWNLRTPLLPRSALGCWKQGSRLDSLFFLIVSRSPPELLCFVLSPFAQSSPFPDISQVGDSSYFFSLMEYLKLVVVWTFLFIALSLTPLFLCRSCVSFLDLWVAALEKEVCFLSHEVQQYIEYRRFLKKKKCFPGCEAYEVVPL